MKHTNVKKRILDKKSILRGWHACALLPLILALAFHATRSGAQISYLLSDVNSQVFITPSTQAGMNNWIVDGQPVAMQKQWFWYRVGPAGPEQSLDGLPFVGPVLTDRNPFTDPSLDTFAIKYQAPQFNLELSASLQGGAPGSGWADITEQIKITNLSAVDPLEFHFFQYVDFDLGQPFIPGKAVPIPDDDRIQIKLDQITGLPAEVTQWDLSGRVTETIITPDAALGEAAFFNLTLVKLNNGGADSLNGVLGAGPGDVAWAFQWDFNIDPLKSVQISKDKIVLVPEPGIWSFVGLGCIGFLVLRRWIGRRS